MSTRQLVAGIDSSTQSTKLVVVDIEDGRVLETLSAPHAPDISGDLAESDPEEWWQALREVLAQSQYRSEIRALGIGAQQRGMVLTGEGRTALRKAVLWCDQRSFDDAVAMTEELGGAERAADLIGSPPQPAYTAVLWRWLRRTEPDVAARAERIHQPHGWLVWRLTGQHVIDPGDASTTTWWSTTALDHVDEVLDLPGIAVDRRLLPDVLPSGAAAGTLTAAAAAELDLAPGTVVSVGTGDNPAAALPLIGRVGDLVMSLGTSGTLFTRSPVPSVDPTGVVLGNASAEGDFLPLVCVINCTRAVDQFAATLGLGRDDVAADSGSSVVLPYLIGEWTPQRPDARGLVYGVDGGTTREQLLRAAYEGVVWSLLSGLDDVRAQLPGGTRPELRVIGGGARSRTWTSVLANLWGAPVRVPPLSEFVALGAAMSACAALTGASYDAIRDRWAIGADDTVIEPDGAPDPSARIAQVVARSAALMSAPLDRPHPSA
jgi:xylulokinase